MYNIYSDSSILNKSIGIGCYYIPQLYDTIKTVKIDTNKSTLMEIYTLIQSLDDLTTKSHNIESINIYTDCQGFVKLANRRNNIIHKLDANNNLHNLYLQYYNYLDKYNIVVHKIKGHTKKDNRITEHEKIFDTVDKYTRKISKILP